MTAALNWTFDNSYGRLPGRFFTRLHPTPVKAPRLVLLNTALAGDLGLSLERTDDDALAALFSGNALPQDADPLAQAYAGHQFGGFSILGDGRAIVLGEQITPNGARFDIQFKGSGPTPYSRRGDGRAALGPMLREHIVSEAMSALGVPTTRSLAVVATGEAVYREDVLPGAVLTRVAASHLRVGTFQYAAARQDREGLAALLDYAVKRHDPDLVGHDDLAFAFLTRVAQRQADLIVEWMRVGFVHGVMNTDNMAISGETIDYGPCAFMDAFDPATCFSSIDHSRRYAYGAQPMMAQWNLARLADALLASIDPDEGKAIDRAQDALNAFARRYQTGWTAMMRRKLGLSGEEGGDEGLIEDLLTWMRDAGADYTNSFDALTEDRSPAEADDAFALWRRRWTARRARGSMCSTVMRRANPAYIPRNHKVEEALAAGAANDLGPLKALMAVLATPYEKRGDQGAFANPNPQGGFQTFCGT